MADFKRRRGGLVHRCAYAAAPLSRWSRIVIENAKDNFKYRQQGRKGRKRRRRIRDPDLEQFQRLASENGISMGYDETCDTIWFETRNEGEDDIVLSGRDTGGQFIRLMVQIAINSGSGRQVPPLKVDLPPFYEHDRYRMSRDGKSRQRRNGKSCMLVGVQMRMWSLRVGDCVQMSGGDPLNDDALAWNKHAALFEMLQRVIGASFRLENLNAHSPNEAARFKLLREEDAIPVIDEIACDIHQADQIMMGIASFAGDKTRLLRTATAARTISISFPRSTDYHPDAMVRALRAFDFDVADDKPDNNTKSWAASPGQRVVRIAIPAPPPPPSPSSYAKPMEDAA